MGIFDQPTKKQNSGNKHPIPPSQMRPWSKDEVKALIKMWPDSTMEQICAALDRPAGGVGRIVHFLRKMGIKLARKGNFGHPKLKDTIIEVLEELKMPYNK